MPTMTPIGSAAALTVEPRDMPDGTRLYVLLFADGIGGPAREMAASDSLDDLEWLGSSAAQFHGIPFRWFGTNELLAAANPPVVASSSTPAPERTDDGAGARKGKSSAGSSVGPPSGAGATNVTIGAGAVGKVGPASVATDGAVRSPVGPRIPRVGAGLPSP